MRKQKRSQKKQTAMMIFLLLKNTEKIKETIVQEDKPINKFRYKGKLVDILEFTQKNKKKNQKIFHLLHGKYFSDFFLVHV